MKIGLSGLAFALLLSPLAAVAGVVEEELDRIDDQWHQALVDRNWQGLAAMLADRFFYNTTAGTSLTRDAFLAHLKSGAVVVRRAVRDQTVVRDHGQLALVTGLATVDATVDGQDRTLRSRYLHVWANEAQGWRLVARQATYLAEKK